MLVGGGPWDQASATAFTDWALACGLPVGATFRRQDVVDNTCAAYAGDVGIGINPRLGAAHPRLRPADRGRHPADRDRDAGLHAARAAGRAAAARARPPRPGRARARLPADARAAQRRRRVRGRRAGRRRLALGRLGGRGARGLRGAPAPPARTGRRRRPRRRDRASARGAAGRRDPHQRRGQLLGLGGAPLPVAPLRHAARAAERRDGLRHPGCGGGAAAAPRRARDRVRRRRRLPDVRAGARDRRAGGAADRRDRGQQRRPTARSACTRSAASPRA